MDAPFWEIIIRSVTSLATLFALIHVFFLLRAYISERKPIRYLTGYMVAVLFTLVVYRFYVLWVGLQNDADGSYARDIEPLVRALGASLLSLLLLGVGFVAIFHLRHREAE